MKNKTILVDVDGVLVHFDMSFKKWMEDRGHLAVNFDMNIDCLKWYGIEDKEVFKLVNEYQSVLSTFSTLPSVEQAESVVKSLSDEGYRFVAITACNNTKKSYKMRWENLVNNFGDVFDDLYCVGFQGDKSKILKKYQPTWWIEGSVRNAELGHDLGHKSLLFDHPRNKDAIDSGKFIRVKDWQMIKELVLNEL